jgi:2-polyprenyl-3-methyl-5-hydroxy-6-metoxy-1,4-benzoquinol methylase
MNERLLQCRKRGNRHPDWQKLYEAQPVEAMPWYHPDLDPDLKRELSHLEAKQGRFLDIGTGPGIQAVHLARMGFEVTGTDLSPAAIHLARSLGSPVNFVVDDILQTGLDTPYDFVLDRGCFHVIDPSDWGRYLASVGKLTKPGGLYFIKCFSTAQDDVDFGPWRFSKNQLREIFGEYFVFRKVRSTFYHGSTPRAPRALFGVLQRRS